MSPRVRNPPPAYPGYAAPQVTATVTTMNSNPGPGATQGVPATGYAYPPPYPGGAFGAPQQAAYYPTEQAGTYPPAGYVQQPDVYGVGPAGHQMTAVVIRRQQRVPVARRLRPTAWCWVLCLALTVWPLTCVPCCIEDCYEEVYSDGSTGPVNGYSTY